MKGNLHYEVQISFRDLLVSGKGVVKMNINGNNIFMGAYAERHQNQFQFNQSRLSLSTEKSEAIAAGIKEVIDFLKPQMNGVRVSISKEDMDFLCSEEGFLKMKKDAEDLYIKNVNQQKTIAKGRSEEDAFWGNTGNQWLVFSETLYNNGFYDGMSDEEVKEFEDTLAYITSGMDCLSRSQYLTGIEYKSFGEEFKFFMNSGEAAMELESSTEALRYLADKMLPEDQREEFNKLIDKYYAHNTEVISEYNNPMESFNRVVAGMRSVEIAKDPVDEYLYTVKLGEISRTGEAKKQYQSDMAELFAMLQDSSGSAGIWDKIRERFLDYSTNNSKDNGFRNYVFRQSQYLFEHMQKCWNKLLQCA